MTGGESIIGFAVKARKVIFGTDNIESSRSKRLIICDRALSENALKKMMKAARESEISLLIAHSSLEDLVRRNGVKAIAVTDSQMARAILKDNAGFDMKTED